MNRIPGQHTTSLRLSPSFREEVRQMAKLEGVSLSHFVDIALAEKISLFERSSILSTKEREKSPAILTSSQQARTSAQPLPQN